MISKHVYGNPLDTGAVTGEVPVSEKVRHFAVREGKKHISFTYRLGPQDVVYGLGETMGKVNKRGGRYVSFNTDTGIHEDFIPSLYASHNFIIVDGEEHFGAFFDTPSRVTFEIDYQGSGKIRVVCDTKDLNLYQLENDSAYAISRDLLRAVGRSYLPPLWAFGYGQSRFSYMNEQEYLDVVDSHEKYDLPLDYLCMDIDYMEQYRDFSFDPATFPEIGSFVRDLKERGIRLVPIVDAGVKVEPGEPVYEEGVAGGYFCRNKEGGYFRAGAWPGFTHFPDFLNSRAREWFGRQYRFYTEKGLEGFWNDMNEPAIFYSEYTLHSKAKGRLLQDYKSFFHDVDGRRMCHYDVHNLFGAMMTRASSEGLERLLDHRFLLFSRSSYIGAGRYGGVWTGDNTSKWEHLMLNVRHMPSLNMCGFLYSGADTGGFLGNCDRELLLRWLAFSVFTPLMRNHTVKGSTNQEAYQYGDPAPFRTILRLRYRLLPYIYSEYMKAALMSDLYIKPVAFVYQEAKEIEDQLLVGDSLMIAPILKEGETKRRVFLPEAMTRVTYDGEFHCRRLSAGWHEIRAELDQVVFFIRKDRLLPVGKVISNTRDYDVENLVLLGDGESYDLYTDDGQSRDCTLEHVRTLRK